MYLLPDGELQEEREGLSQEDGSSLCDGCEENRTAHSVLGESFCQGLWKEEEIVTL